MRENDRALIIGRAYGYRIRLPCGYEYAPKVGEPSQGIAPGTPWEDVPESFECPICGLGKDAFEEA